MTMPHNATTKGFEHVFACQNLNEISHCIYKISLIKSVIFTNVNQSYHDLIFHKKY